MTKNIALTDDIYSLLKNKKGSKSFTKYIEELLVVKNKTENKLDDHERRISDIEEIIQQRTG